jgi:hypothetical protein
MVRPERRCKRRRFSRACWIMSPGWKSFQAVILFSFASFTTSQTCFRIAVVEHALNSVARVKHDVQRANVVNGCDCAEGSAAIHHELRSPDCSSDSIRRSKSS